MKKTLDDAKVREARLQRNPLYRNLSSMDFAVVLMSLVAVATLLVTFFPQGMDEAYYVTTFGKRLYGVYESLGLLGVLRSWWFMLLYLLLLAALVLCAHARSKEGVFRGPRGTMVYESEFSIPKGMDDILLIFPVLLRSIGFRGKRIATDEGRSEVTAVRGVSPAVSSFLFHAVAAVFLLALTVSYLFSWGGMLYVDEGKSSNLPSHARETRLMRLLGGREPAEPGGAGEDVIEVRLVDFARHYKEPLVPWRRGSRGGGDWPSDSGVFPLVAQTGGRQAVLTDWGSVLDVNWRGRSKRVSVQSSRGAASLGLCLSQGPFFEVTRVVLPALDETVNVALPAIVAVGDRRVELASSVIEGETDRHGLRRVSGVGTGRIRAAVSPAGVEKESGGAGRQAVAQLSSGEEASLGGVLVRIDYHSMRSLVRIRHDPGRPFLKLGALLVILFGMLKLYMYWYTLKVELRSRKGGATHLLLRMRASGFFSSPASVSRKIASLLAK
ncbi:MAG: cytochrome c biogenesis protein ResB [Candidatus Eisenbacteria bacterium]